MTKKTSPAYRASKEETIPINKLHPFSNHPFHIRHDLEFSELVDSISESGIITPIIVRPKVGVGYEVISGHRRWEACKELGIESIPARVEYMQQLNRALAKLPVKQSQHIYAHFFLGKSSREIATAENVSVRAVQKSVRAGLKRLGKILKND